MYINNVYKYYKKKISVDKNQRHPHIPYVSEGFL